jgi:hypothetical protein
VRRLAAVLVLVALPACGARTIPDRLSRATDATADVATDGTTDAPWDAGEDAADAQADGPRDGGLSDAGCKSDMDCDDGIPCTVDQCDPNALLCRHLLDDTVCDDGLFCTGDETCTANGCVTTPRSCADAVSCTVDTCDEGAKACQHAPNDALCPISHGCDPQLGCQARALAHDTSTLYEVRLPSGQTKAIGATGNTLTDVALHPNATLYGISYGATWTVSTTTGQASFLASLVGPSFNALDAAPNGNVYAGGGNTLYRVVPQTGQLVFEVSYPPGRSSSGDLAFVGSRLLATATSGGASDDLIEFDLTLKTSKLLGSVGHACVWGLAAYGPTLYGLTCQGRILVIDTTTGKGSVVNQTGIQFYGASAR